MPIFLIRKTRSLISLTCLGMPATLMATDFTVEGKADLVTVGLDLSHNLKVRDKTSDFFTDARDYCENHADLASIRIPKGQVCKKLRKPRARYPDAEWSLIVHIDGRSYSYAVSVCDEQDWGGIVLRVPIALRAVPA